MKTVQATAFEIHCVAFSPDGTKIVSNSDDNTIKVWEVVHWSRNKHRLFDLTTRRFVVLVLWLNKRRMRFPDEVLDMIIMTCLS